MKIVYFLLVLILFLSCKNKPLKEESSTVAYKLELIATDKAFSEMSSASGMKKAYIEYIDSNGVLLRPENMPIIGANAIDYLIQQDDTGFQLSWEPRHAEVANSGELGFTYGIYAMRPKDKDTVIYGTYTSIWRKQKDGKWKLALDSGNQGIGEP
jgi:ketosteroid isomerase-like protein